MEFLSRGLSRLDGTWVGKGQSGSTWQEPSHPFAADLDLFGRGSLFELLCEARTLAGERTLAGWLQHPAGAGVIHARHAAVAELASRVEFRESLAILGQEVRTAFDERTLIRWAEVDQPPFPTGTAWICRVAVAGVLIAVPGALAGWWTAWPALAAVAVVASGRSGVPDPDPGRNRGRRRRRRANLLIWPNWWSDSRRNRCRARS